ncbi:MAG: glycosyltransferase [Alicyclobacillus herbarius]|uniref:glycosyltransferase n=1 Tax=Alicyclobacillus herbarius TaxID=122960 RepID=UPI002355246C|nr:glycosyltransferase [Alicyclobacillus herbarius]MCL6631854.1 glycosyltransferase [Alicyclobacillus herbarius]
MSMWRVPVSTKSSALVGPQPLAWTVVENGFLFLFPLTAALGPYLLPLHVLGINAYGFRVFVLLCAVVSGVGWLRQPRLPRAPLLIGYLSLGALWVIWGGLSPLWAGKASQPLALLDVVLGFLVALPLARIANRPAEAQLVSLRRGWVAAYLAALAVAAWELVSNHHLPGYYAEHASPWKLHHVVIATFENPNNYAAFITLSLPFLWWSWRCGGRVAKGVYGVLLLTVPALLALTAGRLGIIGAVLALVLLTGFRVRTLRGLIWAACGWGVMYLVFQAGLSFSASDAEKIRHTLGTPTFSGAEPLGSIGQRLNLIRNGIHFTLLSHGLGFGPGSFEYLMSHDVGIYPTGGIINPHNFWVEVLSEYGVIVFCGLLFCLAAVFLAAWRVRRDTPKTQVNVRAAAEVVLAGLPGYGFAAMEHSSYINQPVNWAFLTSMMAMAVVLRGLTASAGEKIEASQEGDSRPRVVHLTSVHGATDTRIFIKECRTLAAAGYEVVYLVPGGQGGWQDGVHIVSVGDRMNHRLLRMTVQVCRVLWWCLANSADLYHFHDPELLWVGWLLKALRRRVIYDVHEDVPQQILSRHWLPRWVKKPLAWWIGRLEQATVRKVDAVVAATPFLAQRLRPAARRCVVVRNYPRIEELKPAALEKRAIRTPDKALVTYVGDLTAPRGVCEMVAAMEKVNTRREAVLALAGHVSPPELLTRLSQTAAWQYVDYQGWLSRSEVRNLLHRSDVGLVLIHPEPRYQQAYPVKLFEYMAAGVPVVASNFPVWREIVEGSQCGLCVNPLDVDAIAEAVCWILEHPQAARAMGQNGQAAVCSRYSWDSEAEALLALYGDLLGLPAAKNFPVEDAPVWASASALK